MFEAIVIACVLVTEDPVCAPILGVSPFDTRSECRAAQPAIEHAVAGKLALHGIPFTSISAVCKPMDTAT